MSGETLNFLDMFYARGLLRSPQSSALTEWMCYNCAHFHCGKVSSLLKASKKGKKNMTFSSTWVEVSENFFGNSGREEKLSGKGGEELIMSQTLESVLEEQEAIFWVRGIGGGRWVTKLGISLVTLWLTDPGQSDFSCMIDNDIITGAHVQRSQAIDKEFCITNTSQIIESNTFNGSISIKTSLSRSVIKACILQNPQSFI